MIRGGLISAEYGLCLAKAKHEVTVIAGLSIKLSVPLIPVLFRVYFRVTAPCPADWPMRSSSGRSPSTAPLPER